MIHVSHAVPVNEPGEIELTRSQVWEGLVRKADNALPFVPAMSHCQVLERLSDSSFDREIEVFGHKMIERIVLEPEHRVSFTRLTGPVPGFIVNEIADEGDEGLALRFSFSLTPLGMAAGSAEEQEYATSMTGQYTAAVGATLAAIRRIAAGD